MIKPQTVKRQPVRFRPLFTIASPEPPEGGFPYGRARRSAERCAVAMGGRSKPALPGHHEIRPSLFGRNHRKGKLLMTTTTLNVLELHVQLSQIKLILDLIDDLSTEATPSESVETISKIAAVASITAHRLNEISDELVAHIAPNLTKAEGAAND